MRTLLTLLLVPLVALAGCQDLIGSPGGDGAPTAARLMSAHLTPEDLDVFDRDGPDDVLAAIFDVVFEYTHRGGAIESAGVDVRFVEEDGDRVTRKLSDFTARASVKDGDVVRISGVHIASDLLVSRGGETLFARAGVDRDWFTAGGVEIPLAGEAGAGATWTLEATGKMGARLDGGVIGAEGVSVDVSNLLYGLDVQTGGSVSMRQSAGIVRFEADLEGDATATVALDATAEGERVRAEFDGSAEWRADGRFEVGFDSRGEIESVGAGGSMFADASYRGFMEFGGERDPLDDGDIPHPLIDETMVFEREELALDLVNDPVIQDFFSRIWSADLAVGDRLSFELDSVFRFSYSVEVAGADSRKVDGKDTPTFRMLEHLEYDLAGDPIVSDATYWIERDSHLPVFAQFEETRTFDGGEIMDLFADFDDEFGADLSLPDGLSIDYTTKGTLRMTGRDAGMAVPGIIGLQGLRGAGMVVPAAAMFVVVSDLGMHEDADYPPNVSFTRRESNDEISVAFVDAGVSWDEFEFRASDAVRFQLNGPARLGDEAPANTFVMLPMDPMRAGDVLAFCAEDAAAQVDITLLHEASNSLVFMTTFSSIAAC